MRTTLLARQHAAKTATATLSDLDARARSSRSRADAKTLVREGEARRVANVTLGLCEDSFTLDAIEAALAAGATIETIRAIVAERNATTEAA